jgi:integrase
MISRSTRSYTPDADMLTGTRDGAILATLLYHGLRREKLCRLKVCDCQRGSSIMQLFGEGKSNKVHYVPVAIEAQRVIAEYLNASAGGGGHRACRRAYSGLQMPATYYKVPVWLHIPQSYAFVWSRQSRTVDYPFPKPPASFRSA